VKIRLEGTPAETEQAVAALREVFEVQEVSDFCPNRGRSVLGRVYVTAQPITPRTGGRPARHPTGPGSHTHRSPDRKGHTSVHHL
jgi:hypothetical protein